MDDQPSDTSLSLPSPRHLAGAGAAPASVADSPTLSIRQQRERTTHLPECSSPLFLADRTSPTPAPSPKRPRRARLTAEEREQRQAERVRELAERQRWREANRIRQRRSDTMRDLIIRLDAEAAQGPLAPVLPQLREKWESDGATVHISTPSLVQAPNKTGVVVFERRVRSEYDPVQKLWTPLDEEQVLREATRLHIAAPEALQDLVRRGCLADELVHAVPPALGPNVHVETPVRHVLVVLGLDAYLKQLRTAQHRAYTEHVRQRVQHGQSSTRLQLPSEDDARAEIDQALLRLQMLHACYVVQIPQVHDAVDYLYSIACDVSIRPYKLLEARRDAPVRASRTITGQSNLATFQAMLEQIPRCTPAAIYAITERYPTFHSLMAAFASKTPEEGTALLSSLEVRHRLTQCQSGRSTRRLGPQLARRIYDVFTNENGEAPIDA